MTTEIEEALNEVFEDDLFSNIPEEIQTDLTNAIINEIKTLPATWEKMNEDKQKSCISRIHSISEDLIKKVAIIIKSENFDTCVARVSQVVFKSGIEAKLTLNDKKGAHGLADHQGKRVLILLMDTDDFGSEGELALEESDQSDLIDSQDVDSLYSEAVEFVIESNKASISSIQRKLRIGYNRAARLIEAMEADGVISEQSERGSRKVLLSSMDEFYEDGEDDEQTEEDSAE